MNLLEALLLGLIQGVTEFLPVSSSGHLTLFGKIFNMNTADATLLSFTTLLHMGTLISVFIVMRREILAIIRNIFGPRTWQLVIATIPAVLAALFLGDWIESLFGGQLLGYEFLLTGIILLTTLLVKPNPDHTKDVGYPESLAAGIGQAIAIVPGVSRSGATLASMLYLGVNRQKAISFSFLMSIPAILGAFLLDILHMLDNEGSILGSLSIMNVAVGVIAAALSGWLVMRFMLKKLTARGILVCALYVIGLGSLILLDQTWLHLVF